MRHNNAGFCGSPEVGPNVTIIGKSSGVEGTQITCYCQQSGVGTAPNEEMISTCMSDGSWSPDPRDLECLPNNNNIDTISTLSGSSATPPLTSKLFYLIALLYIAISKSI